MIFSIYKLQQNVQQIVIFKDIISQMDIITDWSSYYMTSFYGYKLV